MKKTTYGRFGRPRVNKRPGFHVKSRAPETTCLLHAKKRNDNGTPKKIVFLDFSINTHFQRLRLQLLKQVEMLVSTVIFAFFGSKYLLRNFEKSTHHGQLFEFLRVKFTR